MPSNRTVVDHVVMEGGMGAVGVREGPSFINIRFSNQTEGVNHGILTCNS